MRYSPGALKQLGCAQINLTAGDQGGKFFKKRLAPKDKVLKKLSDTRLSARGDSVKAVISKYANFKDALIKIFEDIIQKLAKKLLLFFVHIGY